MRHPSSPSLSWKHSWHNDQLLNSLVNICLEICFAAAHHTLFHNKTGQLFTVMLLAVDEATEISVLVLTKQWSSLRAAFAVSLHYYTRPEYKSVVWETAAAGALKPELFYNEKCLWQSQLVICLQTMRPIRHAAKTYSLLPVVIYFYHAMQASLSCNTSDVTNNAACVSPEAFFPRTVQKCRREPAGAPAANKEFKKRQKKRKDCTFWRQFYGTKILGCPGKNKNFIELHRAWPLSSCSLCQSKAFRYP